MKGETVSDGLTAGAPGVGDRKALERHAQHSGRGPGDSRPQGRLGIVPLPWHVSECGCPGEPGGGGLGERAAPPPSPLAVSVQRLPWALALCGADAHLPFWPKS